MSIPCKLVAIDSVGGGINLWAISQDGSKRAWSIHLQGKGVGGEGASFFGLPARLQVLAAYPEIAEEYGLKYKILGESEFELVGLSEWSPGKAPILPE